jgi:hypothetical protein
MESTIPSRFMTLQARNILGIFVGCIIREPMQPFWCLASNSGGKIKQKMDSFLINKPSQKYSIGYKS